MPIEQLSALSLVAAILANILLSGVVLLWGRKLPRQGDWLVGLGLFGAILTLILLWSAFGQWNFEPIRVLRGWVLARSDRYALGIGMLEDPLSYSMSILFAVVASALVWGRSLGTHSEKGNSGANFQVYAGAGLCFSGASLAWLSVTPWVGFLGVALATLGGFLSFGPGWSAGREADEATQFFRERSAGLILALLGALIMIAKGAAAGAELEWGSAGAAAEAPLAIGGFMLLLVGLFLQLQPFPLLGWLVRESSASPLTKVGLAQGFGAAAAFGLLVKLQSQFPLAEPIAALGWLALASAFLTALTGLFQSSWPVSLGAFASSGFSLAVCTLAFSGLWAGVTVLIATLVSISCVGLAGSVLGDAAQVAGGNEGYERDARTSWLRTAALLGMAGGTGVIGFLSSGGRLRWIAEALMQPWVAASFAFVFFAVALLGWKTAWSVYRFRSSRAVPWAYLFLVYILVILGLGVVWTGSPEAGAILSSPDLLFTAPLTHLFLAGDGLAGAVKAFGEESGFVIASWIYWGSLIAAIGLAFWSTYHRSLWNQAVQSGSPVVRYISSGYGVDRVMDRAFAWMGRVGGFFQRLVDQQVWDRWIPGVLHSAGALLAHSLLRLSSVLSQSIDLSIRRTFEVPGKLLQLVQSGNVQWYLFFAVGSGIAMLIHFLKFTH